MIRLQFAPFFRFASLAATRRLYNRAPRWANGVRQPGVRVKVLTRILGGDRNDRLKYPSTPQPAIARIVKAQHITRDLTRRGDYGIMYVSS